MLTHAIRASLPAMEVCWEIQLRALKGLKAIKTIISLKLFCVTLVFFPSQCFSHWEGQKRPRLTELAAQMNESVGRHRCHRHLLSKVQRSTTIAVRVVQKTSSGLQCSVDGRLLQWLLDWRLSAVMPQTGAYRIPLKSQTLFTKKLLLTKVISWRTKLFRLYDPCMPPRDGTSS